MKYLKNFASQAAGIGYTADTPFVTTVKGINRKVLYIPKSVGDKVKIIDDGDGFLTYGEDYQGPANNEIWGNDADGNILMLSDYYEGAQPVGESTSNRGIVFENDVTTIGENMFKETTVSLIHLPKSVTTISNTAFNNCWCLLRVAVESVTPPTAGSNMFDGSNSLEIIYVPAKSVNAYKAASGWSAYADKIQAITDEVDW